MCNMSNNYVQVNIAMGEKREMRKTIKKRITAVLIVSILIPFNLLRTSAFELDLNNTEDIRETIVPKKVQITYGPYNNKNTNKKHAYEPFKNKEETDNNKVGEYRKDSLLVKIEASEKTNGTVTTKSVSLKNDKVASIEKLTKENKKSGVIYKSSVSNDKTANWYKVNLKEGSDVLKTIEELKIEAGVVAAEPDYIRKTGDVIIPDATANEKMNEQWYLNRFGIKEAWQHLQDNGINPGGSRDVVVAVIDTGVDYNHPDLAPNMWTNTGEIPGDGLDNDNNGFIDDIHGASTVGNKWGGESGDPMDDNGHGTHVAGIIASAANNTEGGVGVAFNVQIMALKAGQSSGIFSSADIIESIQYAIDKGADVINMSFGGYGRNQAEEDMLADAFGSAVLIASAGNNNVPNEPIALMPGEPMYPASYPWVVGVMAENSKPAVNGDNLASFSNWDAYQQNSIEYEVMAPGTEILSTLPNGNYSKWSGTSMAAPIVSGIAALVSSKYADNDNYSSRFIMGQLASTGIKKQGVTYSNMKPPTLYMEVNAYNALTETPKPNLNYLEHYIFDKKDISNSNNEDGIVDAGETIDIGVLIRNHWGKADNAVVKIDAKSSGNVDDPYVTFLENEVNYGAVGNFAVDDNGFIYEEDVVTGVSSPFKIKIAENTPNDHLVKINITMSSKNGFDNSDNNAYITTGSFTFLIRKAKELPRIIDKDMTLTKNDYWIVSDKTLIEKGVTVKVQPGTQIQFWGADPQDPYSENLMPYIQVEGNFLVEGTAEEPVDMFTGILYQGHEIKIVSTKQIIFRPEWMFTPYEIQEGLGGFCELKYARISNPTLAVNNIDHCYVFNVNVGRRNRRKPF
jgi:subtilisin family serine protease